MALVFFSKPAERDLKHLPIRVQEVIRLEHIPRLSKNSEAGKFLHGPLRGYFSYDFHSGGVSYRIAYEYTKNKDVIILMIDARDNFYKKFTRRVL
jgi:mRNA-degrading endonuclease RelE of RelBE toxin-antitoxin system